MAGTLLMVACSDSSVDPTTPDPMTPQFTEVTVEPDPMNANPPVVDESHSSAVINNGTVQLGINNEGHLNFAGNGVRYLPTGYEAIWVGCLCEGWGVADAGTGIQGWASISMGMYGVGFLSFSNTANSAISVVNAQNTFKVTHDFHPSATPHLYEIDVTIENISGAALSDVRYTRVMDWDVNPTPFWEHVTIQGTAASPYVLYADNNGFQTPGPLLGRYSYGATGDFVDFGPFDHGALFDFGFGALPAGGAHTFKIYYGAAGNEATALAALATVGASVYSLGQSGWDPAGGTPTTFIFGFQYDNTPPTIAVSVTPSSIWPPNHKMVDIEATVTVSDNVSAPGDITVELVSVVSSEPDDALGDGDGNTVDDIQGADVGTDDRAFQVRAERQGGGNGRIYTVTYRATDKAGNSAEASAQIVVPHDKGNQ